ncbi:MAG: tripartite tricarboxylate transporter substrate binding protein [Burkholderiales bacterium]|nr:tripartite tricarboxylate transporter substrate binding protein [Burkholderiales bacterium]
MDLIREAKRRRPAARLLLACVLGLAASAGQAQTRARDGAENYPSKAVWWVLPYSAGTTQDLMGRQLGPRLAERLGQPVVVENRAGAGGIIGFGSVAKAVPDGYMIMMGNNSLLILSAIRQTPYDPLRDFDPVTLMGYGFNMLMVNHSVPVGSLAELVSYSRANPGKLNYSSPPSGTYAHLAAELFRLETGADLTHIPYNGMVAAVRAMITGDAALVIASAEQALPFIRAGKVKVLGVIGERRSPRYPDVPSTYELGYREYSTAFWYGLLVPAGTPRPIVARLNAEMRHILAERDLKESLAARGVESAANSPEQFAALMKAEMALWQKVIKLRNIKAD